MCGRFGLEYSDDFYPRFQLANLLPSFESRYNIAPSQTSPIVFQNEKRENTAEMMKWGLVPFWAKDPSIGNRMINARIESVAYKPSFRSAFIKRRCLVPASNFYEWQDTPGGKIPYNIRSTEDKYMAFAGLYEIWQGKEEELKTFTIVTTVANKELEKIHGRMPVVLDKEEESDWLSVDTPQNRLLQIADSYPDMQFETYEISRTINNPGNEGEELVKRISES